jgi:hypothetical protein
MITSSFHLSLLDYSLICSGILKYLVSTIGPSFSVRSCNAGPFQLLFPLLSTMSQALRILTETNITPQSLYIAKGGQPSIKTGRNLLRKTQTKSTLVFKRPTDPFERLSIRVNMLPLKTICYLKIA